jgi:signal transduction histidine kinase
MSLLQYLSQRLLLLGLVISAGIFYIVYILYQWGLDDSTEYYLTQDMQWAVENLANQQALPSNTSFRQFYLSNAIAADADLKRQHDSIIKKQILPTKYASLLTHKADREFIYLEDDVSYQYGLHQRLDGGRALTLIHQFYVDETVEDISLFKISLLASAVLILTMLLGSWFIYKRIAVSMQHLLHASQQQKGKVISEFSSTEFIEVEIIINSLNEALENLENKNQQERLFIQTLSHELRTPMATVQVALELLAKKELNENVRAKLDVIFSSNQKMQSLSNDLLLLWTTTQVEPHIERNSHDERNSHNESDRIIDLEYELRKIIDELDNVFQCNQRFVFTPLNNESKPLTVLASKSHIRLLLNNVCKNAIVHSDSQIEVSLQPNEIIISNKKSQQFVDPLVAGSGIGLIIANRAAELLGWKIEIAETDSTYVLKILYKN